jgi:hypothetical protein
MKAQLLLASAVLVVFNASSQASPKAARKSQSGLVSPLPLFRERDSIATVEQQIAQLEKMRLSLLREYTPTSYRVRSVDAEIASLHARLRSERSSPRYFGRPNSAPKFQLLGR